MSRVESRVGPRVGRVVRSPDGGGDDDEQVRDVGHAVHQIGGDAVQVFVREIARREDVDRV